MAGAGNKMYSKGMNLDDEIAKLEAERQRLKGEYSKAGEMDRSTGRGVREHLKPELQARIDGIEIEIELLRREAAKAPRSAFDGTIRAARNALGK